VDHNNSNFNWRRHK